MLLLLAGEPADERYPAVPFAKGPAAQASKMAAAIVECHAAAKIVEATESAIVLPTDGWSEDAFNCLSAWIIKHPDSGFLKFGFIGREPQ